MIDPIIISHTENAAIVKTKDGYGVVTYPGFSPLGPAAWKAIGDVIGDRELKDCEHLDISLPEAKELCAKIELFYEKQQAKKKK